MGRPGISQELKLKTVNILFYFILFYSIPFHSILSTNMFQKGLKCTFKVI